MCSLSPPPVARKAVLPQHPTHNENKKWSNEATTVSDILAVLKLLGPKIFYVYRDSFYLAFYFLLFLFVIKNLI